MLVLRTLLRAALSLSMLGGLAVAGFGTRRACSETADDALWAMCRLHTGAHHLREKIYIVVSLTRHLFADRVQDF